jgi:hypothetical protein
VPPVLKGILPSSASEETTLARRNWHQPIREALRSETGLRFGSSQGGEPARQIEAFTKVTVEIVDGVSEPLAVIAREHPDAIAWWILLNRRKLESAAESLRALEQRVPEIIQSRLGRRLAENDPTPSPAATTSSRDCSRMRSINPSLSECGPSTAIGLARISSGKGESNSMRQPSLYGASTAECLSRIWSSWCSRTSWHMPLRTLAGTLTVGSGRHIDFVQSDAFLVEGLAQFYTDRLCDRLMGRRPSVRTAFDLLNKNQAAPYREFHRWKEVGPLIGEAVRQALIDCRVSRIKDHKAFYTLLQAAHSRLAAGEAGRVGRDELFQ